MLFFNTVKAWDDIRGFGDADQTVRVTLNKAWNGCSTTITGSTSQDAIFNLHGEGS
jgi:hypothetical protein